MNCKKCGKPVEGGQELCNICLADARKSKRDFSIVCLVLAVLGVIAFLVTWFFYRVSMKMLTRPPQPDEGMGSLAGVFLILFFFVCALSELSLSIASFVFGGIGICGYFRTKKEHGIKSVSTIVLAVIGIAVNAAALYATGYLVKLLSVYIWG